MKGIVVISLQNIIYSSFLMVEMLSQQDRLYAKVLLFLVFVYLAFHIATANGFSPKNSIKITLGSLVMFFLFQQAFHWIYPFI
ncbi:hypothetical protein [Bacillus sp. AK128]